MTLLSHKKQKQLHSFLDRVMEPLSDDALADTHYNSLLRKTRIPGWNRAKLLVSYYEAMKTAAHAAECLGHTGTEMRFPKYLECVELYRKALAQALLAPAPSLADVDWKKRQRVTYLDVSEDEVRNAIRRDEDFLAAHPTIKAPRRSARSRPVDKSNNGEN